MLVLRMRRPLGATSPAHGWPAGVDLVPFSAADAAEIHALMALSYARGGGSVPGFSEWWQATSTDEEFDPLLCLVARADRGQIVGFCLCWTSSFVKDLVVHPHWRKRGIASALLAEACFRLAGRGHQKIDLKVEADNPSGARTLYHAQGFVVVD